MLARYWVWAQCTPLVDVVARMHGGMEFEARADGWWQHQHSTLAVPPGCGACPRRVEPGSCALACVACAIAAGASPGELRAVCHTRGGELARVVAYVVDGLLHCPPTVAACTSRLMHRTLQARISTHVRGLVRAHGFTHVERCVAAQLRRVMHADTASAHSDVLCVVRHAECTASPSKGLTPILVYPGSSGFDFSFTDHVTLVMGLHMLKSCVVECMAQELALGTGLHTFWVEMDGVERERCMRDALPASVA